ncbi:hypothetical protein [Arcanobacterium bovis]|uniref:hypothetical protein n=1 Tax=Arcanobacterium bovis TaxID=2529275 RepID=UPI0013F170D7|nr:hypothetical protein [Arcanobacterium bovis]
MSAVNRITTKADPKKIPGEVRSPSRSCKRFAVSFIILYLVDGGYATGICPDDDALVHFGHVVTLPEECVGFHVFSFALRKHTGREHTEQYDLTMIQNVTT